MGGVVLKHENASQCVFLLYQDPKPFTFSVKVDGALISTLRFRALTEQITDVICGFVNSTNHTSSNSNLYII